MSKLLRLTNSLQLLFSKILLTLLSESVLKSEKSIFFIFLQPLNKPSILVTLEVLIF